MQEDPRRPPLCLQRCPHPVDFEDSEFLEEQLSLCLVCSFWYQAFKAASAQSPRKDPTSSPALWYFSQKVLEQE